MNRATLSCVVLASFALAGGCKDEPTPVLDSPPPNKAPATQAGPATGTGTGEKDDHDHDHEEGDLTPIGNATIGGVEVKASQEGELKPGGEAGFEVSLPGGTAKPKAVRFWVGTEDAEGSAKAKAEPEDENAWHGHVDVPDPLPAGSKLWVEIEPETGAKATGSFDLRQ
jgi:hypothetical protein